MSDALPTFQDIAQVRQLLAGGNSIPITLADADTYVQQIQQAFGGMQVVVNALQTAVAALNVQVATPSPEGVLALAQVRLAVSNLEALRAEHVAAEALQTLMQSAIEANSLEITAVRLSVVATETARAALAARVTLNENTTVLLQAQQGSDEQAISLLQAKQDALKINVDATQSTANQAKDEARTANTKALEATDKANLNATLTQAAQAAQAALTARVTANELAIAALQTRAGNDEALINATQAKADAAKAAADVADGKAVAAQTAVLQLQYNGVFSTRAYRTVGATPVGPTLLAGQSAQLTDPASRSAAVAQLIQFPMSFSTLPSVSTTITLTETTLANVTKTVLTRIMPIASLSAVNTLMDVLSGQTKPPTIAQGSILKLNATGGAVINADPMLIFVAP